MLRWGARRWESRASLGHHGRVPSVFVAGSINMDLVATTVAQPRPGETVAGRDFRRSPGGKGANQAIAAAKLGAPTSLVGKVGADPFGVELRDFLSRQGLDTARVGLVNAPTGVALVVVDRAGENSIVVVSGANDTLSAQDVGEVPFAAGDVALSQFEIPQVAIASFFERAKQVGATTMLNAAPALLERAELLAAADVLLVNELESAAFGAGGGEAEPARALEAARRLQARASQTVVVTLGPRGLVAVGPQGEQVIGGHAVPVVDTTGAGDALAGALAARLALGDSLARALQAANAAAAISVGRPGAAESSPTAVELADFMARLGVTDSGTC